MAKRWRGRWLAVLAQQEVRKYSLSISKMYSQVLQTLQVQLGTKSCSQWVTCRGVMGNPLGDDEGKENWLLSGSTRQEAGPGGAHYSTQ